MELALDGTQTPAYASSLIGLGDALLFQGNATSAEAAYREAAEIRRHNFNPGNPNILAAEVRLGEALQRAGKTDEAEPLLRTALASERQEPFPLPPWRIAEAEYALGTCLNSRSESTEGDPLVRSGKHGLRDHPQAQFRWPAIGRAVSAPEARAAK